MTKMRVFAGIVVLYLFCDSFSDVPTYKQLTGAYSGIFVVEMEDLPIVSGWKSLNVKVGFTGTGYYMWDAVNYVGTLKPGENTEISFAVDIPQSGEYHIRLRNNHYNKNDCFIRFHGIKVKEFIKQEHYDNGAISDEFSEEWNIVKEDEWIKYFAWKGPYYQGKWNSSGVFHPVKDAHDYSPSVYLEKGIQKISIGPRSAGFCIDRIIIVENAKSQIVGGPTNDPYRLPKSELMDESSLPSKPLSSNSELSIVRSNQSSAVFLLNGKSLNIASKSVPGVYLRKNVSTLIFQK